jgi:Putative prokaryotic signal transducing protein
MAELVTCANCSNEVTDDSDFCPHCGYLFKEAPPVHCETDLGQEATGVCIICNKLVCPRCQEVQNKHLFCIEHCSVQVEQDWASVFESNNVVDVEMQKDYLESNGIQTVMQNFGMHIRHPGAIRLFVPIPDYLRAKKMLDESN